MKVDYIYYISFNYFHNKCPLVLVKRHCNVWSALSYTPLLCKASLHTRGQVQLLTLLKGLAGNTFLIVRSVNLEANSTWNKCNASWKKLKVTLDHFREIAISFNSGGKVLDSFTSVKVQILWANHYSSTSETHKVKIHNYYK